MKKIVLTLALLIAIVTPNYATHLFGGEITWECVTTPGVNYGKYIFTVKKYRTCALNTQQTINNTPIINPMGPNINLFPVPSPNNGDLSPKCYDPNQELECFGGTAQKQNRTIQEWIFRSNPVALSGIPPIGGAMFTTTDGARPNGIDNSTTTGNFVWRCIMYRYMENGVPKNLSTCYDNSPQFAERPAAIICSGYKFTYNHNATDADLDSLDYKWTQSWSGVNTSIAYKAGFSYLQPLPNPGVPSSPNNVSAVLDKYTGEIAFTSFDTGRYYTTVQVDAYRCQQLIASVVRDIPVSLLNCPPTPTVPPLANTPPQVEFKNCSACPALSLPGNDTVYAGDSIEFYVSSTDIQFLPGFLGQTNYLQPSGAQFGTNFTSNTAGCLYPPCATLDTTNAFYDPVNNQWKGQFGLTTKFKWKTGCNHLAQVFSCFTSSNTYTFVFKVFDDWCPAPGMNFQTFAITVLAPPAIKPPKLKCANIVGGSNVLVQWDQPVTSVEDTLDSFRKYIVYRAPAPTGPYDTLAVITNINTLQYLDLTANANISPKYYFVQGISSCNDQGVNTLSDTISSMSLTANSSFSLGGRVALDWNDFNPGNRWGSQTTKEYYVWQVHGTDTTLIDTVTQSIDTIDVYHCYPTSLSYFVTVEDTTLNWGCTSKSFSVNTNVGDNQAPPVIGLNYISYDINNNLELSWNSTAPDIGMYHIYKGGVAIDSVPPPITTFTYTPGPNEPCILEFGIRARDTCGNMNNLGITQFSMCNVIRDVVRCDSIKEIKFSWNKYNPGWSGTAGIQEIWRSVNGGPYTLIDSVTGLDTIYSDTNLIAPASYRYRVRSWELGKTRSAWSSWDSTSITNFISAFIVDPPVVNCVSYLNDSTIRLEWEKPTNDSMNFNKYVIYHSSTGPASGFTIVDSLRGIYTSDNLAWDSTGYTHRNVNPNINHYYHVISGSGCTGQDMSFASNTIRAINLSVNKVSDSVNGLQWNPAYPTAVTPLNNIWRDGGLISSTPYGTENYQDVLVVCDKTVEYQITYPSGAGCDSKSRKVSGDFRDKTPPAKQFLDSVSMSRDSVFTGLVGWSKNPSSDVAQYYVLSCTPSGGYKVLDTLQGSAPLFFQDIKGAPLKQMTSYSVVAEDSCGNNRLSQQDLNCHSTIHLTTTMDFCDESILLEWNSYQDFTSGKQTENRVNVSINGGPFEEVARTSEGKYRYKNLVNGNDYCFYVQSWDNEGAGPFSSSSGILCQEAEFIRKPQYAYMRYVTVDNPEQVRMCMKIDLDSDIGEYWIKRSNQPTNGYRTIATVPLPDPLTPADSNFCYQDEDVKTDNNSYYYRIDVIDPCGGTGISSNIARTMLLKTRADNDQNSNILTWNRYEEWEGGVKEYEVWRGTDAQNMRKIASLPLSQFSTIPNVSEDNTGITYIDDAIRDQATTGNGEFCYRVVAKEGSGTFKGIEPETSRSNISCTVQYPLFYIPTGFTPNGDGLNDVFRPLGAFHDLKAYHMEVYNRWGERIYSTDDYNTGWDGTYKGQPVIGGTYAYIVNYTAADGKSYEKQGTVALNR